MTDSLKGACGCGHVRFHLAGPPIVTHCCHCTQCQRETGSAFAVNLMIETERLVVDGGAPTRTGRGVAACPSCGTGLWGYHPMFGDRAVFVKAGVLADPPAPQAHCFTSTKQAWVTLSGDAPVYAENYDFEGVLSAESRARAAALLGP